MFRRPILPSFPVRAAVAAVVQVIPPVLAPAEKAEVATLEAMTAVNITVMRLRDTSAANMTGLITMQRPEDSVNSLQQPCVANAVMELAPHFISQRTKIVKVGTMAHLISAAET